MTPAHTGMSFSFCRWQDLTDRFADQMIALARQEPGAAAALKVIRIEIEQCRVDVQAHGAAMGMQ